MGDIKKAILKGFWLGLIEGVVALFVRGVMANGFDMLSAKSQQKDVKESELIK